jgi:hypothetical protein
MRTFHPERTPYFFLTRRPIREARLRSYLIREHRRGRPLLEVLDDPYVARCGTRTFCWDVLCRPETIAELEADVVRAIEDCRAAARP